MAKKRIAILGGGVGSLSTALGLTATQELRDQYDVTVYQMGWRLGGKGATGRNRDPELGMRVEEHGLHVWLGFYQNAFATLQSCYEELERKGLTPNSPFQKWDDALKPQIFTPIGLGDGSTFWDFEWPVNADTPGEGGVLLSPWGAITQVFSMIERILAAAIEAELKGCLKLGKPKLKHAPIVVPTEVGRRFQTAMQGWKPTDPKHVEHRERGKREGLGDASSALGHVQKARHWMLSFEGDHLTHPSEHVDGVHTLLESATGAVRQHVSTTGDTSTPLHVVWELMEIMGAIFRGFTNPKYGIMKDWDLNRIDNYELLDWLKENGAPAEVCDLMETPDVVAARQPVLRALYDLAFAYQKKGGKMVANFAAGTALRVMIRTAATYKGAPLYEMQSGMGEVIVSPMYLVLKDRGVKFEFFRKVTKLELSEDKRSIQRIHMDRQVRYSGGTYTPTFEIDNITCWPSEPFWEQIEDGDAMKAAGVNWESNWNAWKPAGPPLVLDRDATEEDLRFDLVVLGISLGAFKKLNSQPSMCQELIEESTRFRSMTEELGLVPTLALQLWMDRTLWDLGWHHSRPALVGAVEPIDIWADMTQVMAFEKWPTGGGPKSLHYLCGPLNTSLFEAPTTDASVPGQAYSMVEDTTARWMDANAKDVWPEAVTTAGGFDWNVLYGGEGSGPQRLTTQFLKANVDPTECCVTSWAGTTHVRLWADQQVFENLYFTGDWARSGLNTAGVESAVMAGLEASRAICGQPTEIVGDTFMQARATMSPEMKSGGSLPLYVTTRGYGQQVSQIPGLIDDATCYGFGLPVADVAKLQGTVDHFLNAPTGGAVNYTVLGNVVLTTFLHAPKLFSTSQEIGYIPDSEFAFWVPLIGTTGPGREKPRLVLWNPYLVLDNSQGAMMGREVWGFRKEVGSVALPLKQGDPLVWESGGLVFNPLARSTPGRTETLIKVEQSGDATLGPLAAAWHSLEEAWEGLRTLWEAEHDLNSLHLGLELLCQIVKNAAGGKVQLTNLKQFRDAADSTRACYQAVIESTCTVQKFGGAGQLSGDHAVTVSNYQSHDFIDALGLPGATFNSKFGIWVKMSFTADPGWEVWKA